MQKMLIKHGNSLALVIDKPILDLLQITINTPLEISTNGDQILIQPCRNTARQKKLEASLKKINASFSSDLERLAQISDARQRVQTKHSAAFKKLAE